MLALGFSLAFGAMFSKTWRVHKIFTNKKIQRTVSGNWYMEFITFYTYKRKRNVGDTLFLETYFETNFEGGNV